MDSKYHYKSLLQPIKYDVHGSVYTVLSSSQYNTASFSSGTGAESFAMAEHQLKLLVFRGHAT